MNELKTISDSKKEFHLAFPYVISPIYRRLTDELLVELHLLSHQKSFKANNLFSIGLNKVFQDFMQGYKPAEHVNKLFDALCSCNGFNSKDIKKQSEETLKEIRNHSIESIEDFFNDMGKKSESSLSNYLDSKSNKDIYYSRLSAIGLLTILKESKDNGKASKEVITDKAQILSEKLGFSSSRVSKDISLYNNNLDKLKQALELIDESIKREKKMKEERKKEDL